MPKIIMSKFDVSVPDESGGTGLGVRIVQRDDGINVVEYSKHLDEMGVPSWFYSEVLEPRKLSGNVTVSKSFLKILVEMAIENSKTTV